MIERQNVSSSNTGRNGAGIVTGVGRTTSHAVSIVSRWQWRPPVVPYGKQSDSFSPTRVQTCSASSPVCRMVGAL